MPSETIDLRPRYLFQKYAHGRIPPLVALTERDKGLLNGDFLAVFQKGFQHVRTVNLGILLCAQQWTSPEEKWLQGDFQLNERLARDSWTRFCKLLRSCRLGDERCEQCDRRRAVQADESGHPIAYLCDNGMIDFAAPITVQGITVAVAFAGQRQPSPTDLWAPCMLDPDGFFRKLETQERGVSLWVESRKRIRAVELSCGFGDGVLGHEAELDAQERPTLVVGPDDVAEVLASMDIATRQLSELASSTFELERERVIAWIRSRVMRSLAAFGSNELSTDGIWDALSDTLDDITEYFGFDYAIVLSDTVESESKSRILCQARLPSDEFPRGETSGRLPDDLVLTLCDRAEGHVAHLRLTEHLNIPTLAALANVYPRGTSGDVLAVATTAPKGPDQRIMSALAVFGRKDRDITIDDMPPFNRRPFRSTAADISMVLQSALLVDQLKDLIRKRDLFLEDVAHDIRAPIQNMIFQSALLKRGAVPERDYPRWAGKIATQARRLHMVSKRVWAMAALDKGTALKESPQKVSVSEIVHEHRASLEAVAAARNVEIWVDPVLSDWAPIMVHKELFSQTVLNLLDNGVKYSSRHTQVRIDGKWSRERVRLSFVSRGIPVPEDEKEHIFERYYRTSLARSIVPAGTGIGLYIAKKFADHYGGIEVYSEPVQGTDDYVTEFRLYINQRR